MRMKKLLIVIAVVMLTGFLVYAQTDKPVTDVKAVKEAKVQTICPVEGGKINKKIFVDVKGKRIYMCCSGCIESVKADPDKYMKILEDQGATKPSQVKENAKASGIKLSADVMSAINSTLGSFAERDPKKNESPNPRA